ncbi:MAG: hypothetical protein V4734_00080, partial [Terriglobus sp.]
QDVIQLSPGPFLRRGILKPLLSMTPVVPVFVLAHLWISSQAQLFVVAIACTLLSMPMAFFWGMEQEDRQRLRAVLAKLTHRFA